LGAPLVVLVSTRLVLRAIRHCYARAGSSVSPESHARQAQYFPHIIMIEALIKFFVLFFVVVEPISLIPMFAALTEGASVGYKRKMACKAVILAGLILVAFALAGGALLDTMGISLNAFAS